MSKKNKKQRKMDKQNTQCDDEQQQTLEQQEVQATESATDTSSSQTPDNEQGVDAEQSIVKLQEELAKEKKEYLFLMADFDNFRKRTSKEKLDLIKNGAESAMRDLLPVVDDLERAIDAINKGGDLDSLKEGVNLIYNKFQRYLESQHVTPIDSTGKEFDTDLHEAVTMFPAPDPSMKGKVIDTTIKGYMINDKVLRHAKVVVGQ